MVRQTFYSTVMGRGKVLCARRGERPEVQRADLRGRGFLLHTSARGARADCWGRVGSEIFRGPRAVGSRLHPCHNIHQKPKDKVQRAWELDNAYTFKATEAPARGALLDPTLCMSSSSFYSVTFIISFNKLENICVSWSSVSCSSKFNLMETPTYSSCVRSTSGKLGLQLASVVSACWGRQSCGTEPLTCGI